MAESPFVQLSASRRRPAACAPVIARQSIPTLPLLSLPPLKRGVLPTTSAPVRVLIIILLLILIRSVGSRLRLRVRLRLRAPPSSPPIFRQLSGLAGHDPPRSNELLGHFLNL